jgi:predicted AAA+ superfamily ATPase
MGSGGRWGWRSARSERAARCISTTFGVARQGRRCRGLVLIDEIQRRPELFPVLRVLADRRARPARFLILGSSHSSEAKFSLTA